MIEEIVLPRLGDMTEDVVIVHLYVAAGDAVSQGDAIVRVETDKVEDDVLSPRSGTLTELRVAVRQEVSVGEVIAMIEVGE